MWLLSARAARARGVAGDGDAAAQHAQGQRAARARPPPRVATAAHRHEHCAAAGNYILITNHFSKTVHTSRVSSSLIVFIIVFAY